ncbi:hypothetical protein H920_08601 [Fukomys damarensis]|uniref:Uncharacterized protein n=1 Tax=Fukomys damarensis TaxID=885580 RepID=A0A091DHL1_FUKDA|nr:hypothetical protein H920_08601 [Fukomys damarensis]
MKHHTSVPHAPTFTSQKDQRTWSLCLLPSVSLQPQPPAREASDFGPGRHRQQAQAPGDSKITSGKRPRMLLVWATAQPIKKSLAMPGLKPAAGIRPRHTGQEQRDQLKGR